MLYSFFWMIPWASELYVPTFQNTVFSVFKGIVSRKNNWDEVVGLFIQEKVWLKIVWANWKEEGQGWGVSK